jgi:hypothetical protein
MAHCDAQHIGPVAGPSPAPANDLEPDDHQDGHDTTSDPAAPSPGGAHMGAPAQPSSSCLENQSAHMGAAVVVEKEAAARRETGSRSSQTRRPALVHRDSRAQNRPSRPRCAARCCCATSTAARLQQRAVLLGSGKVARVGEWRAPWVNQATNRDQSGCNRMTSRPDLQGRWTPRARWHDPAMIDHTERAAHRHRVPRRLSQAGGRVLARGDGRRRTRQRSARTPPGLQRARLVLRLTSSNRGPTRAGSPAAARIGPSRAPL